MGRSVLKPITVRFTEEAWEAIRDIADSNRLSQAEVVRMAVAGNLSRYLGDIKFVDPKQGEQMRSCVVGLVDIASAIRVELNRIGVNYNQEVRVLNTEAKYGGNGGSGGNGTAFPGKEIDKYITRYEAATRRVAGFIDALL